MSREYRDELIKSFPCITQIWLFGSRANGTARPDSDWDHLIRADDDRLLHALCQSRDFNRPEVDVFVVVGTRAMRPWPAEDGQLRVLDLSDAPGCLNWHETGTEATYIETKPRPGNAGAVDIRERKARLVHER